MDVGYDLRGIIHYGQPKQIDRILPSHFADINATLDAISTDHPVLVRTYVGNSNLEADEAAARLHTFLDRAAQFNVRVIANLLDYYWELGASSWHTPKGLRDFYTIN